MTGVVVDAERAELRGPRAAVLAAAHAPAGVRDGTLLADGLAAVRAPAATWTVTGAGAGLEAFADHRAAALLIPADEDAAILRAVGPSGLLGHLVAACGLRPRPSPADARPLTVPAPRLAAALARRDATGAGLAPDDAARLQPHLDALVAHWRIEVRRAGAAPLAAASGWYVEVLDTARGAWLVEAEETAVRLVPVTATAVFDELAALPGRVGLGRA